MSNSNFDKNCAEVERGDIAIIQEVKVVRVSFNYKMRVLSL